jgi:ABC-type antimicrobial peptide transport system permease subunit
LRIGELNEAQFKFDFKTFDVEIVGLVAEEGKGKELGGWSIWTSIDNMRSIIGFEDDECSEINIALSSDHENNPISSEDAKIVEEQLIELFDELDEDLIVIAFRALILDTADEVLKDVLLAFNLFGALIIFSGVLLLVNIQLIQVEDRVQQLGILRAIGSRRREIVRLFLVESFILGFLGSFLGIGGGYTMSIFLVDRIGKTFFDGEIALQPNVTAGAVGYSIALGLILAVGAGVFPAIRAAGVDVIEVIRGIKKTKRKKTGKLSLAIGLSLIVTGISVLVAQSFVYDSILTKAGWNTAIEQWVFMGGAGGILLGISVLFGYLFSRKIMGNGIGLTFITLSIFMLLLSLPQTKGMEDNNKILITLVIVLALGTIIWVGVNLNAVTNFFRGVLYRTRIKKGVSLIASKYMTSKTIRSTLTFGIFTLVLTMNIFASVYQATFAYNTLESVEFYSGGAPIYIELDSPIANETLVNVETDLLEVDDSIDHVKGINSTLVIITSDEEVELDVPTNFFPGSVDLIYNNTFKNGDEYVFDFLFEQSLAQFNDKYKQAGSERYQLEYSHELWDFFYNRTKFNNEGYIDNENGMPTVISTTSILKPGDVFNITGIGFTTFPVIVLANIQQYPFSLSSMFPTLLITPTIDFFPRLNLHFGLYPSYMKFLVKTSEDFKEGRNTIITEKIETFFNGNESKLVLAEDFVAASANNVWDEMLQVVDFQVRTFDFLQYFVGFGLIVGAMGMVIIAMRNVAERRREIGMKRAIGYKKTQIIGSIMLELFILAGLGLIIGLINSIILGWAFARLYDWLLLVPPLRILLYTGIMIGIALIAAILPGIRASQVTPAEAIRYVG